jgi:hypothetical protein
VPNPEGDIKVIQVNDRDRDLFDFELEGRVQTLPGDRVALS